MYNSISHHLFGREYLNLGRALGIEKAEWKWKGEKRSGSNSARGSTCSKRLSDEIGAEAAQNEPTPPPLTLLTQNLSRVNHRAAPEKISQKNGQANSEENFNP